MKAKLLKLRLLTESKRLSLKFKTLTKSLDQVSVRLLRQGVQYTVWNLCTGTHRFVSRMVIKIGKFTPCSATPNITDIIMSR